MSISPLWCIAAAGVAVGCVGSIAVDQTSPPPTAPTPPVPTPAPGAAVAPPPSPAARPPTAGPRAPLRRLSRFEYNNTIRDLLGDRSRPADKFLSDETPGAFADAAAAAQTSPLVVEQYRAAAETLAANAVKNLPTLLPCKPDPANDAPCARAFVEDFGLRAFRRPLAPDESAALMAVYDASRADADMANGLQAVIETVLQAPSFLYRPELPPPGAAAGAIVPLSPYEVATRLSYFLIGTMPDKELLAAARAGQLGSPGEVEQQARRLLKTDGARDAVTELFRQWLALHQLDDATKDTKLYPRWNEALRGAMRDETLQFVRALMTTGDGKLGTLLTSTSTSVSAPLAALYGLAAPAMTTTGPAPAVLDAAQRAGILTQASLLTMTAHAGATSPTRRGKFVREQLMCQPPPPPPPNVDTSLSKAAPGQSVREIYRQHAQNPACSGCHTLIDPIGFGFENYDPIGAFRTSDGAAAIDSTGQITGSQDLDGPFSGAVGLARKLAGSRQVAGCVVKQWFRAAHGRDDEAGDAPSVREAMDAFTGAGLDLRELLIAVTRTDAFRTRVVEVTP